VKKTLPGKIVIFIVIHHNNNCNWNSSQN